MAVGLLGQRSPAVLVLIGFVAGALAVLTFHQATVWLLSFVGGQGNIYSLRPVGPLRVPQILDLAFWGGLWGCVFALLADRFPRSWPLWLTGFAFGAIVPTLVGWFVVAPLKHEPVAQGFVPSRMWRGPIINGMFGVGTALFFDLLRRWSGRSRWV
jgi:hypothetical protein